MYRKQRATPAAALSFIFLAVGCNSSNRESRPTLSSMIGGVGSTFVDPLMQHWVLAFERTNPQFGVNYRPEGSGAGFAAIKSGTSNFAASDAR